MQTIIIDITSMFFILLTLSTGCLADLEDPIDEEITSEHPMLPSPYTLEPMEIMRHELAGVLDTFQETAGMAEKQVQDGVVPQEEIEQIYMFLCQILDDIIDFVRNPNNAYDFLKEQGLDKIVTRNLVIRYPPLRGRFLVLIKMLFDITPTTTKTVIPWGILDKLMDIFEQDDNLTIKSQVMEIISVWLPNNARAQERVMRQKGLEPFYKQIHKLDSSAITMTLKLFNDIITEHMTARNKKIQRSEADYTTLRLYQKIGLIERMSTPAVCNGLLNIFVDIWPYSSEDKDALPPVLNLIQNIKPHCLKVYKGRSKAIGLIHQILSHLRDPTQQDFFERLDLNATEISSSLTDFFENIQVIPRFEL